MAYAKGVNVIAITGFGSPQCVMDHADTLSLNTTGFPAFHRSQQSYPVIGTELINLIDAFIAAVPPECPECDCDCPAYISSAGEVGSPDCVVDIFDLLFILANWGSCPDCEPGNCPADISSGAVEGEADCVVDIFDLLFVLANWGPCASSATFSPPETVQDCWDRYWPDIERLNACLEWVAEREMYLPPD